MFGRLAHSLLAVGGPLLLLALGLGMISGTALTVIGARLG